MVRRKSTSRILNISKATSRDESRTEVIVHKRRTHIYTRALQEIKRLRKSVLLIIPKVSFLRVVKQIIQDLCPNNNITRVQESALLALQEAAEAYIVQFFEDSVLASHHAKRKTLMQQDMILVRRLRGRGDVINR